MKQLTPWERNPRTIDDAAKAGLKRSLEEFGDLAGIVFNIRNQRLISGHQRSSILNDLATIEIERTYDPPTATGTTAEGSVIVNGERFKYREVDWTEEKHAAANVAANNELIAGSFTGEIESLLNYIEAESTELFESLRFGELADNLSSLMNSQESGPETEAQYKSQYGVIAICRDEEEQKKVFESLVSQGLQCKVVVT